MPDQPPNPENSRQPFDIPEPKIEKLQISVADGLSFADAVDEVRGFQSRNKAALTRSWWDWIQAHSLKWILFVFVIGINIWWTKNVLKMVWLSGSKGSGFHLDNSVLIALVTTSVASFLALVVIVAKNLFPDSSR